jgi:hypothetical protein
LGSWLAGYRRRCGQRLLRDALAVSAASLLERLAAALHDLYDRVDDLGPIDVPGVLDLGAATGRRLQHDDLLGISAETLDWLSGELEADREARTDPGVIYEDAESFKAALHAVRSE